MNYSTKSTLSLVSGVVMSFLLCLTLNLSAQKPHVDTARIETGALLELKGKIWSGAGQAGITGFDGFESYWDAAPAHQKPNIFLDYYDSYNIGPKWTHELKQELLKFHRQGYYVIPQIGYYIDTFWEDIRDGKHEKELDNLVKGFQYLGMPVFLRIGYEFNNQKDWPGEDYIKVFQIITDKLREGGVEVATVFNAGLSGHQDMKGYYPGNDYVDWIGFNAFQWDLYGGHHATALQFFTMSDTLNKPILIGEASTTAVNHRTAHEWEPFFEPYFKMIEQRKGIKQMCYINWSWDTQDMVAGNDLFPWGDSRIHMPWSVKDQFFTRMDKEEYFFASSEVETRKLFFYDDEEVPTSPSGLSVSGENIVWSPSTDTGGSGHAHYTIYKNGEFWDYVTTPEYPVADLGYGGVANVQVLAMDRAGNASPLSDALAVQMNERYELIYDGEFDLPPTSWAVDWQYKGIQDGKDPKAKPSPDDITGNIVEGGLLSGDKCIKLTWNYKPENAQDWKIQLFQNFQVVKGEVYTISFMAKAAQPVTFKLKFMDHAPEWDCTHFPAGQDPNFGTEWQVYEEWDVALTTEPQTFTFVTTSPETETAKLAFMMGHLNPVDIYLDAISVSAGSGSVLIANAGGNKVVEDKDGNGVETITLDGSASSVTEGNITSYVWDVEGMGTFNGAVQTLEFEKGKVYKATLTVTADDGSTDTDEITIEVVDEIILPPSHWAYTEQTIPGDIEAEFFDEGGEGNAYKDNTSGNAGGQVRPSENVDIGANPYAVGWTEGGEWLKYTVKVTPGTYELQAVVASALSSAGAIKVSLDGTELATFDVPNTGGWNSWQTLKQSVNIPEGGSDRVLQIDIIGGNLNIDQLAFVVPENNKKATFIGELDAKLYPNPVKRGSEITIDGVDSNTSYKVVNLAGKTVLRGIGSRFNAPSLPGKYIILLNDKKKTYQLVVE